MISCKIFVFGFEKVFLWFILFFFCLFNVYFMWLYFLVFILMIVFVCIRIGKDKFYYDIFVVEFLGFLNFFGVCVYLFMC